MLPVRVTSPLATSTVTVVMPYLAKLAVTSVLSVTSGDTGGGVAGGLTVRLLVTDFTPSTLLAICSAAAFSLSERTSPVSVTAPLVATTVIPEEATDESAASFDLTLAASVASSGPLLHDNIPKA